MPRKKSPLATRIEYAGVIVPVRLIRAMPFASAMRLGERLGDVAYRFARPQRRVAERNLQIAFPERSSSEHLEILRATFRNLGRVGVEFCHMHRITPENVSESFGFEDPAVWEHWRERLREKSAVCVTAHFGNWELFAHCMGVIGSPVHFFYRPFRNELFDRFVARERSRAGTKLIARRSAGREVIRLLRKPGTLLGVPFDQNATGRWGVFADFFGVPASTYPGIIKLAQLADVPIVPVFPRRVGENGHRHELAIHDPIELPKTGDREARTRIALERCNAALEKEIRLRPDHWIWMHKRWRTRPEGEPPIY